MRRLPLIGVAIVGVILLGGCTAEVPEPSPSESEEAEPDLSGDVVVYAAASLTDAFGALGDAFSGQNPSVTVTLSFGGSSGLAEGIVAGAPVDVFASASPATMQTVVDADLVDGDPLVFARNILEIAVPVGNAANVTDLTDFADESKTIALCAPEVPCGAAAATVFDAAGITPAPDTLEQDVRAALTKVQLGEVDAALVYRTDVLAAADAVEGIPFDGAGDAINDYSITPLTDAPNPDAAQAFVDFVLGPDGQAELDNAGFQTE